MARFGKIFTSIDYRHAVVAYAGDPLLQDRFIQLDNVLTSDLVVGSVVNLSTGALATDSSVAYGVVIEPARIGDVGIVVANPVHTILKSFALVFADGVDADAFKAEMISDGYYFADIDTFSLPTT